MSKSDLILPGEGTVIASVKVADVFVEVLLLQPLQLPHETHVHPPGETIVCNEALANHLADNGVGAILYEKMEARPLVMPVTRAIQA